MSETTSEETAEGDDEDEEISENPQARINCSLGGLELEVECGDVEDAEELFERIWGRRLSEADSFSEALRDRMVGHQ